MAARLSEAELIRRQAELSAKISEKGKQASKKDLNAINDIQKRLRLDYKYDYSEAPNLRINRDGELVGRKSTFSQAAFTTQQPGIVAQQQTATGAFENTQLNEQGEVSAIPVQTASVEVPQRTFASGSGQINQISNVPMGGVPVSQLQTQSQFERAQLLSAYEQNLAARGLSDAQRAEEINRVNKYTVVKKDPATGRLYLVAPDQSFETIASTEQLNSQTNLLRRVESGTVRPEDIIPVGKQLPLTPENIAAAKTILTASDTNAQLLSRPTSSVSSDFSSPLISDIVSPQAFRGTTGYVERGVTPLGFKEGLVEPLKDFAAGAKPLVTEFNKGFEAALKRAQADADNNPILTASFLPAELIRQPDLTGSPTGQLLQSGVGGSITTAKGLKAITADITSSGFSKTLEGEAPAFEQLAKGLTPQEREGLKVFAIGALSALAAPVAVSAFEALPAAAQLAAGTVGTAFGVAQAKESVTNLVTDPSLGTVVQAGIDLGLVGLDIGATTKAVRSGARRAIEPVVTINEGAIVETNVEVIGSKVDPLIVGQFQERAGTAISALAKDRRITANAVIVPFQVEQFGLTTQFVAVVPKKTFAKTFTTFEVGSSAKSAGLLAGDVRSATLAEEILFEPYIVKAEDLITSGQSTILRPKPKNPEDLLFAGPRESIIEAKQVAALEGNAKAQAAFGFDEPKLPRYTAQIVEDKPGVIKIVSSQSGAKLKLSQPAENIAKYEGIGVQKTGDEFIPLKVDVDVQTTQPKGSSLEVSEFTTSLSSRPTRAQSFDNVVIETADDAFEDITQSKIFAKRSGDDVTTIVKSRIATPQSFSQSKDIFKEGSIAEKTTTVRSKPDAPPEFAIDPTQEVTGRYELDLIQGGSKSDKRFSLTGEVESIIPDETIKQVDAYLLKQQPDVSNRIRIQTDVPPIRAQKKLIDGVDLDLKGSKYTPPAFGDEQTKNLPADIGERIEKTLQSQSKETASGIADEIFAGDIKFASSAAKSTPEAELSFLRSRQASILKPVRLQTRTSAESISEALGIRKGRRVNIKGDYKVGISAASRIKPQVSTNIESQLKTNLKDTYILKSESLLKQDAQIKPVLDQKSFLRPVTKTQLKPVTDTILKTLPETKPIDITTPRPLPPLKPTRPLPPETPIIDIDLDFSQPKEQAYDVLVKQSGKFTKVNKQPQSKLAALALGEEFVDKTVAKSFKLAQSNKPSGPAETGYRYDPMKLRPSKQKGMKDVYVEKNKYAIDTEGERLGITVKGLRARRAKQRPFRIM